MHQLIRVAIVIVGLTAVAGADDKKACPTTVTQSAQTAFPGGTVDRCKPEHEHGKDIFEVVLKKKDGARVELDVDADGTILQTEEKIAVDKVPAAVMKAFAAKYPKAKAGGAEKQTAKSGTSYEIKFSLAGAIKEATFTEDGKFVEEE